MAPKPITLLPVAVLALFLVTLFSSSLFANSNGFAGKAIGIADFQELERGYNLQQISEFVRRAVRENGVASFKNNPEYLKKNLWVQYEVGGFADVDQGLTGDCWLYAVEQELSQFFRKELDRSDFQFSHTYLRFFDQLERANSYFELMVQLSLEEKNWNSSEAIEANRNFKLDSGDFSKFKNIVKKYGIVPADEMPETIFSKNTMPVNWIISRRAKSWGMKLLEESKFLSEGGVRGSKLAALGEIYSLLVTYYGKPPVHLSFRSSELINIPQPSRGNETDAVDVNNPQENVPDSLVQLSPHDLLVLSRVDLDQYVTISFYPHISMGTKYEILGSSNVVGGENFEALNLPIAVAKSAIRRAIKKGHTPTALVEMENFDREKNFLSPENDLSKDIFRLNKSVRLNRAGKMRLYINRVLHAMLVTGCDEEDGKPIYNQNNEVIEMTSPLWKLRNSWGDFHRDLYASDAYLDESMDWVTIRKEFLPEEFAEIWENDSHVSFSSWNHFLAGTKSL